jgi:hypothetical protein
MKKFLSNPGFEFIFSLSLIIILGLPPVLMAQTQKDLEIKIENGDTIINGKNIKQLSAADRQNALKDINHLRGDITIHLKGFKDDTARRGYSFNFRRDSAGRRMSSRVEFHRRGSDNGDREPLITENIVIKDSLGNIVAIKPGQFREMLKNRINGAMANSNNLAERNFGRPFRPMMNRAERKNSQNFDFVNTDKDGISTHVSFHVSEASNDDLKRMPHVEGGKFEVEDLNIVPEFTTGKTLLMFNLPSKAVAEVKLHDSEGRLLWSEKTVNGNFSKSFAMGLNGVYYLQIKQGGSIAVKRIMKEG